MTVASDTEARLRELKTAWSARESENNEIVSSAKSEDGVLLIDEKRRKSFQANIAEMKGMREEMDMLSEAKRLAEWGAKPEANSVAMAAAAEMAGKALDGMRRQESKTIGQMFTSSEDFETLIKSGAVTMPRAWKAEGITDLGAAAKWIQNQEAKNVYPTSPAAGAIAAGFKPLYRDDVVVQAFRKVRVRDLFPVQPTTAAIIEFFRVTGFVASNAASVVPEWDGVSNFGLKPHTNLNFAGAQCPTRTIAHWEAAHRNVLNDVPQLQGIIDTELLYGLRLHEDYQILFGTGTGEDLLGIMNTPSIQTYSALNGGTSGARSGSGAGLATDTKSDDVRRAATKAILAYYEPTGVVMNPTDWEAIETLKDSTGAYIIAIAVAVGGQQRIWRLPVVDTPAMTQGKALVGAFGLGATLYDREEGSIRIAEQHADFFLRNALVILAEERLALATKRPESFVNVTFGS